MSHIAAPLQIRNITFKNRIIKGAMSEALANHAGQPNRLHLGLYEAWQKVAWAVLLRVMSVW